MRNHPIFCGLDVLRLNMQLTKQDDYDIIRVQIKEVKKNVFDWNEDGSIKNWGTLD